MESDSGMYLWLGARQEQGACDISFKQKRSVFAFLHFSAAYKVREQRAPFQQVSPESCVLGWARHVVGRAQR